MDATGETLKIKKYPNRRFYDATRSRHVTLDELHELVRQGHRIEVTDTHGKDITNLVLTQILLEHDPPKLDLFPASLLHQAIQANQVMVRRFVEEYFAKAMDLFVHSRQQFDAFLAQAGLSPLQPLTPFDWARRFLIGFGTAEGAGRDQGGSGQASTGRREVKTSMPDRQGSVPPDSGVEALRAEVEALRAEIGRMAIKEAGTKIRTRSRPDRRRDSQRRRK